MPERTLGSKRESLNKRVRETIANLGDDELTDMQGAPAKDYTPFARRVVEEELARRRRSKALTKDRASGGAPTASLTAARPHSGNPDC